MRENYNKVTKSIAFFPIIISIGFLLLSWLMLEIDFTDWGKNIKSSLSWLSLKDASTARSIVSTIAAGILSFTVFSFSMVMILLNQAASQMSNRILETMIGNRFQQMVLGFYIGTIVYSLFLLSTIRDINSGIYVPALSIYLLILLTIVDIFLFIYFLHFITESVKYSTIIQRTYLQTKESLNKACTVETTKTSPVVIPDGYVVTSPESGYFQGYDIKQLREIAEDQHIEIYFMHPVGTYLLKGTPLLVVKGKESLSSETRKKMFLTIDFYNGQPIERNPYYGFHHLAEVALKALSPGINDPATAVLSLNALTDLLAYRLHHFIQPMIWDDKDQLRIVGRERLFMEEFNYCILPIWDYGKEDRYIQQALFSSIDQLKQADREGRYTEIFNKLLFKISQKMEEGTV